MINIDDGDDSDIDEEEERLRRDAEASALQVALTRMVEIYDSDLTRYANYPIILLEVARGLVARPTRTWCIGCRDLAERMLVRWAALHE